jgi:hypothetical protein
MSKLSDMVGKRVHVGTSNTQHFDAELVNVNKRGIVARVDFSQGNGPPELCFFPWTNVVYVAWQEQGQEG